MKGAIAVWFLLVATSTVEAVRADPLKSETITEDTAVGSGKYLNTKDTSGSVLARAARMGASVVITSEGEEYDVGAFLPEPAPEIYSVKEGDTLWDISERFFGDSYAWPKIWSFNTGITNPNWIYPGDTLLLSPASKAPSAQKHEPAAPPESAEAILKTSAMPKDAIFIRSRGFIDKDALEKAGEIVGAHKEISLLSQHDETYVEFPKHSVRAGERFAVFSVLKEEVDSVDDPGTEIGKLVEIEGFVRVLSFDSKNKIARAVIEESVGPLERGALVGEVRQYWNTVPAVKNTRDIEGNIIAFLDPVILAASNQVVFVDRGASEGVKEGNSFFAVERRDGLRRINDEPDDKEGYPVEVIAEIRVVETRPHTSTCLITSAIRELEVGQKVEMRKGY